MYDRKIFKYLDLSRWSRLTRKKDISMVIKKNDYVKKGSGSRGKYHTTLLTSPHTTLAEKRNAS